MKTILNLILGVAILIAIYFLYSTISEPILFKKEYETRSESVKKKLSNIQQLQEMYKEVKNDYAYSYDSLKYVLKTDSFSVKVLNSADTSTVFKEIKIAAIDSIQSLGINLDSIMFIPFSDKTFDFQTDSIQLGDFKEPVIKISTRYSSFMGKYADAKFVKYNRGYNPEVELVIGNLTTAATLEKNW